MSMSLQGSMGIQPQSRTGTTNPFKGTGYRQVQSQQFTPDQMRLFQQLFSQTDPQGYLSKLAGGDQSQFEQSEAPALRQFNEIQGNLASRFSGAGTGARRSSGFQNASNQAAQDFAGQLRSQRIGLQRQALQDLMGISQSLLGQRPYENLLIKKQHKPKWWETAARIGLPIAGGVLGGLTGGPLSALLGSQVGNAFGSGFSGGGE